LAEAEAEAEVAPDCWGCWSAGGWVAGDGCPGLEVDGEPDVPAEPIAGEPSGAGLTVGPLGAGLADVESADADADADAEPVGAAPALDAWAGDAVVSRPVARVPIARAAKSRRFTRSPPVRLIRQRACNHAG
jgi:hypothetical protein